MSPMPSSTTSLAAERRWMSVASRVHDDSYRDLVMSSESEDREGDSSPGRAPVTSLLWARNDNVPEEGLGLGARNIFRVEGRPRSSFPFMGGNEFSISESSETSSTGEHKSWEDVDVPSPTDMRHLNGGRGYARQTRSYQTSFGVALGELRGNDGDGDPEGSRTGGAAVSCQRESSNASEAGTASNTNNTSNTNRMNSGDARDTRATGDTRNTGDTRDTRDTRERGYAALGTSPERTRSRQRRQSAEDGHLDFARPALPTEVTDGNNLSESQRISCQVQDAFVRDHDRDKIVAVLLLGVMLGMAIPESARAFCSFVAVLAMVQVMTNAVVTVTETACLQEKRMDVLGEDSIAQYDSESDSSITLLAKLPPDGSLSPSLSQQDIAKTEADRSSILTNLSQELRDSMRSLMQRVSSRSLRDSSLTLNEDDYDERPFETEVDGDTDGNMDGNTDGDAGAGGTVGYSLDAPNRLDSTILQKEVIAFLPQAHRDFLASEGEAEQAKLVRQCLAYANGELDLARKVCARFSKFRVENGWGLVLTANELEVPLRSIVHTLLPSRDRMGRAMLTFTPARMDMEKCSPMAYQKMLCFLLQETLKDQELQTKGLVLLVDVRGVGSGLLRRFEFADYKRGLGMLSGAFPAKLKAIRIVHPNWALRVALSIAMPLLSNKMRSRLEVVSSGRSADGSLAEELADLKTVPVELGIGGTWEGCAGYWEEWVSQKLGLLPRH